MDILKILIEKPVFSKLYTFNKEMIENVFVAYNILFNPIIQRLSTYLSNKKIYSIKVYVGQYLPDWRPNTDYSKCYSASREKGAGY